MALTGLSGPKPASFRSALAFAGSCLYCLLRLAELRVDRLEGADRRLGQTVQQRHQPLAVEAVVDRPAHAHVLPGRILLGEVDHPWPHVRIAAGDDLEAGALQARHGIRRRHLDPIDLARPQRGQPCRRLGHREQDHLVELGNLGLLPIAVVPAERHADPRLELRDLEGPRTRRRLGELGPRSRLLELRRARVEHVGQHVGEVAERPGVGDLDRIVVDLAIARNERVARLRDRAARRVELLGVLLVVAIEIPDRGVGIEFAAVMEFHALAQMEDPLGLVVRVLLPSLGKAGPDVGELVGALQVP